MERTIQERFEQQLLKMRDRLLREIDSSEQALREDVSTPGDTSSVPTHPADSNAEGIAAEIAIAQNEEHLLEEVEQALARIEHGTYGTCESCGEAIGEARLEAVPYARRCIKCARQDDHQPERPKRGEPRRFR